MINEIQIFDLDGTIIDSSHRYRLLPNINKIDLQHWRDNCIPEKIEQDTLLPLAEFYKECLNNPNVFTIVATARVMQSADFNYLENVLGMPDHIIYRKESDNRRGAAMKGAGLRKLFSLKQFQFVNNRHFWEDNIDYLKPICDEFNIIGHYVPSNQGY